MLFLKRMKIFWNDDCILKSFKMNRSSQFFKKWSDIFNFSCQIHKTKNFNVSQLNLHHNIFYFLRNKNLQNETLLWIHTYICTNMYIYMRGNVNVQKFVYENIAQPNFHLLLRNSFLLLFAYWLANNTALTGL